MELTDLIPEEQKIKYLMRKVAEQSGLQIKPEDIIIERDAYRHNVYNARVRNSGYMPKDSWSYMGRRD